MLATPPTFAETATRPGAVRGKLCRWGYDGFGQVGNGDTLGGVTSPQQV